MMSCWSGSASEVSVSQSSVISPTTGWLYVLAPRRLKATWCPAHHWRNCGSRMDRSPTSPGEAGVVGLARRLHADVRDHPAREPFPVGIERAHPRVGEDQPQE